jgi:hypothetical protein
MQQLGLPPPELTNTLPSASSGIDGLVGGETGTDAEACNIM